MTRATTIRPATLADVDRLLAIEHAAFDGDRISRPAFRHQVKSPTLALLVAEIGGVVAGYALVALRRNARHARLYSLAVDGAGGRGLGRELMAACDAIATERGYESMRLEVKRTNTRAIAIYERAGFNRIGEREDYYEDGETALVYEKPFDLTPSSSSARGRAGKGPSPRRSSRPPA